MERDFPSYVIAKNYRQISTNKGDTKDNNMVARKLDSDRNEDPLWGCYTGAILLVIMDFSRVRSQLGSVVVSRLVMVDQQNIKHV